MSDLERKTRDYIKHLNEKLSWAHEMPDLGSEFYRWWIQEIIEHLETIVDE